MRIVTGVLIVYCFLIGGVSLFDTLADPNGQPLKNIVTIIAMAATLFGIFSKRKEFVLAIPVYSIFYIAFAAAKTQNLSYAIGQSVGIVLPLALALFQYRKMAQSKIVAPSVKEASSSA